MIVGESSPLKNNELTDVFNYFSSHSWEDMQSFNCHLGVEWVAMKEMERRVFKRRLNEICKKNRLELTIEPRAGSHESWKIFCPETQQTVCFTLTSHRIITKGVQREVVKSAAWFGTKIALGEIVRGILEKIFDNWP